MSNFITEINVALNSIVHYILIINTILKTHSNANITDHEQADLLSEFTWLFQKSWNLLSFRKLFLSKNHSLLQFCLKNLFFNVHSGDPLHSYSRIYNIHLAPTHLNYLRALFFLSKIDCGSISLDRSTDSLTFQLYCLYIMQAILNHIIFNCSDFTERPDYSNEIFFIFLIFLQLPLLYRISSLFLIAFAFKNSIACSRIKSIILIYLLFSCYECLSSWALSYFLYDSVGEYNFMFITFSLLSENKGSVSGLCMVHIFRHYTEHILIQVNFTTPQIHWIPKILYCRYQTTKKTNFFEQNKSLHLATFSLMLVKNINNTFGNRIFQKSFPSSNP